MAREQVWRDVFADDVLERLIASNQKYQREYGHYIVRLAERLLRCRAELEQAERERDKWKDATESAIQNGCDNVDRLQARLAAVPALVEALRDVRVVTSSPAGDVLAALARCSRIAYAALSAYEQAEQSE